MSSTADACACTHAYLGGSLTRGLEYARARERKRVFCACWGERLLGSDRGREGTCVRAIVVVVCRRASARVCHSICAGHEERRVAIGKIWPANTEGRGQRTMLGSDETLQRRTAANCRRTLLFSMRPLNGHTITASMSTRARSATAAQNGAKCQLGSASSTDVILAVAGRESTAGSNRSGSKLSLASMERSAPANWVFARCGAPTKRAQPRRGTHLVLSRRARCRACSCWPALVRSCCLSVTQQQRWHAGAAAK